MTVSRSPPSTLWLYIPPLSLSVFPQAIGSYPPSTLWLFIPSLSQTQTQSTHSHSPCLLAFLHRATAKVTLLVGGLTTSLSSTLGTNAPADPTRLSFSSPSDACFDKDGNVVMTSYTGPQPTGSVINFGLVLKVFMTGVIGASGGPGNITIAADNTKPAVILAQIPSTGRSIVRVLRVSITHTHAL